MNLTPTLLGAELAATLQSLERCLRKLGALPLGEARLTVKSRKGARRS
jgi:hypothetical protein